MSSNFVKINFLRSLLIDVIDFYDADAEQAARLIVELNRCSSIDELIRFALTYVKMSVVLAIVVEAYAEEKSIERNRMIESFAP